MKQKTGKKEKRKSNPGSTTKGSRAHRRVNKHGKGKSIKSSGKKKLAR